MNQAMTTDLQNLPLVVAVDLGGTQIRTAVLQGAKLLSRVGLLTGEIRTPCVGAGRVRKPHYCDFLPSEPDVSLSRHPAQAHHEPHGSLFSCCFDR